MSKVEGLETQEIQAKIKLVSPFEINSLSCRASVNLDCLTDQLNILIKFNYLTDYWYVQLCVK